MRIPGSHRSCLPQGWSAERVRKVLAYYERQSEEEAAAEIEEGFDRRTETVIIVPRKLVPEIRRLISRARAQVAS